MILRTFLLSTFLITSISSSIAADLIQPDKIEFDEGRFGFEGIYIGFGFGHTNFKTEDPTADPSPTTAHPTGNVVSGFAGINRQSDAFVFGAEADIIVGNVNATNEPFGFLTPIDMEYLSTVRGRLGIVNGNTLLFVTGGYAFASFDITSGLGGPTVSQNFNGPVFGAGIEYMTDNEWFARFEYLNIDFGTESPSFPTGFGPDVRPTTISDGQIFRVAIGKKL